MMQRERTHQYLELSCPRISFSSWPTLVWHSGPISTPGSGSKPSFESIYGGPFYKKGDRAMTLIRLSAHQNPQGIDPKLQISNPSRVY